MDDVVRDSGAAQSRFELKEVWVLGLDDVMWLYEMLVDSLPLKPPPVSTHQYTVGMCTSCRERICRYGLKDRGLKRKMKFWQ